MNLIPRYFCCSILAMLRSMVVTKRNCTPKVQSFSRPEPTDIHYVTETETQASSPRTVMVDLRELRDSVESYDLLGNYIVGDRARVFRSYHLKSMRKFPFQYQFEGPEKNLVWREAFRKKRLLEAWRSEIPTGPMLNM